MLSVKELQVEVSCAKENLVVIKVGNIDVGWGLDDWNERFFINMGSITGFDGVH